MVLVSGFDAWVETPAGSYAISTQRYAPDVIHPDGAKRIESFQYDPWPRWRYRLNDRLVVEQELIVPHGKSAVALSWKCAGTPEPGTKLKVRLFLAGRDFHATHHENASFRFDGQQDFERIAWWPYDGVPGVIARSNGAYRADPTWYRNFLYTGEQGRGLDCCEDLASPGIFEFDLSRKPAVLVLSADGQVLNRIDSTEDLFVHLRHAERTRRRGFSTPLERAADAYLARRGTGKTLIAGYPWFGDWGRDTFVAIRGLCIATGRLDDARDILLEWAGVVSQGMLPNWFPDQGELPEFNAVDASLWYIVAVADYLRAIGKHSESAHSDDIGKLRAAVEAILAGYSADTRFGIGRDEYGLLSAGQSDYQLTWMDARVDGRVIMPRIGKPVEVNALWINAPHIGAQFSAEWQPSFESAYAAFETRFWNGAAGSLYDVIDCHHRAGTVDPVFRPNQIFAVGGLPLVLLAPDKARRLVDTVESRLLTPLGLRSLAPGEAGYVPRYEGGVASRDGAYHQGTVWPWLLGPFVEAWVRVRGNTAGAKAEARERFLRPLLVHLDDAGLGHVSEIADAEPPHTPRGCPFQVWSLDELLRLDRAVLVLPESAQR
jgi:predicted glycogen debranching enzyme